MVWDLEYNRIMNLKEKFGPRQVSSKPQRTSKAYFCDSALRSPGDCLSKYGIRAVKINDSISELILDSKVTVN